MKNRLYLMVLAGLTAISANAQDHPRAELFAGFTYTRANPASNVPGFNATGGSAQFGLNFNRWVGFVGDFGAVQNGNIGGYHLDSTFANYLFGPRVRFGHRRFSPYMNVLFGGMHASSSTHIDALTPPGASNPIYLPGSPTPVPPNSPVTVRAIAAQTSFAMTSGGGLDIKINRHLSLRAIGIDYLMTRMQNLRTANDNNQHNIRYTAGLNFTFSKEGPAPLPPSAPTVAMKTCWDDSRVPEGHPCPKRTLSLTPPAGIELCQGSSLTITVPGTPPPDATFQWTINGEPVSKTASLDFSAAAREPGNYKIGLSVSAADYNDATLERTVAVVAYAPPVGSLDVSPREVLAGEKATLTANFTPGKCGGNLRGPAFAASEGTVDGNVFDSSEIRFDPGIGSEQRKTITLTAKVTDDKGEASAQTTLVVKKPAGAVAKRLPDIVFPAGNARVNNCGKRVLLEELKAATDADPQGKVILIGHVSDKEGAKPGLDQQRALNAAAIISAGTGICSAFPASQTFVGAVGTSDTGADYQSHFCGTTGELPGSLVKESETDARYRRVEVWFIPAGGVLPATLKDNKDAVSLNVSQLGCPR